MQEELLHYRQRLCFALVSSSASINVKILQLFYMVYSCLQGKVKEIVEKARKAHAMESKL